MDKGAGHLPPAGAPGQGSGVNGTGQGDGKPPPIPPAPNGPGRSYGAQPPPGYGAVGGHGASGGYGGYSGYGGQGAGAAYTPYAPYGYGWQGPPPPIGKSVAAMVVGIASVVLVITCWGSFLAVFSSVVALCLGVSARRGVERGELGGGGQATAGFVLGIVGLVLSVVISTLLVLSLTVWADDSGGGSGGGSGDSYDARGAHVPVLVTG
ncbi:DUF4190 domain-containing protein [Streptomyces oryzae]|uniref:DUF4190 domain-containing protein n=1 Tax=Streptomyces oryzae TaxID=1434886 RepID=A0ABS3XIC9_9ACTN|nr:DUF4190 domain-containing protein [Streptomyces oryzae]MBO8195168.1 DUF4190 domain-containing protein [Streptomyces oryzae]